MSHAGLAFDPASLAALRAHAERTHPFECCGMAFGPIASPGLVTEVVPVRNVQNELHASDPAAYPRDARTAYFMDGAEQDAALASAPERGLELRALYHSHPDHGAYFSAEDRRLAAPEGWGELYPGVAYLVISVVESGVVAASQFVWNDEREDYDELPIEELARPADAVLDLGDEVVPASLVRARDALRRMHAGQVLEIVSRDRGSFEEAIPGYCEKQRYPVERITGQDPGTTRLRVTKTT